MGRPLPLNDVWVPTGSTLVPGCIGCTPVPVIGDKVPEHLGTLQQASDGSFMRKHADGRSEYD